MTIYLVFGLFVIARVLWIGFKIYSILGEEKSINSSNLKQAWEEYRWQYLIASIFFAILAAIMYYIEGLIKADIYYLTHSFWHIFAYLSAWAAFKSHIINTEINIAHYSLMNFLSQQQNLNPPKERYP